MGGLLPLVHVVQSLSRVWHFVTLWAAARQASLSFTISRSLLKLVHWVRDAIQPSHPLSPPSSPARPLSQHQGLFQWMHQLFELGGQRIGASASVLPMNIQGWFPLELIGLISLQSKGLSRVFFVQQKVLLKKKNNYSLITRCLGHPNQVLKTNKFFFPNVLLL